MASKPSWLNTPSGTMRAALLTHPGSNPPSSCFTVSEDAPKPTLPSQDWTLVRVRATGLNRAELRGRNGEAGAAVEFNMFAPEYHKKTPEVLGEEFVGQVSIAGTNTPFKPGDRVCAAYFGGGKAYNGAYAEFVICHKQVLFRLPGEDILKIGDGDGEVEWTTLGAVPGSMWTAYGSLFVSAETKDGGTVLVHGGSSSVGIWAILLLKARGCKVIATTRQKQKAEKLKEAGADHVIIDGNNTEDVDRVVKEILEIAPKGVTTVLLLVGPNRLLDTAFKVLALHGCVVTTGVLSKEWVMKEFSPAFIPGTRKLTMHTGTGLAEKYDTTQGAINYTVGKIVDGTFRKGVFVDSVLPLREVGKAHDYMEANKAVGKLVLKVD